MHRAFFHSFSGICPLSWSFPAKFWIISTAPLKALCSRASLSSLRHPRQNAPPLRRHLPWSERGSELFFGHSLTFTLRTVTLSSKATSETSGQSDLQREAHPRHGPARTSSPWPGRRPRACTQTIPTRLPATCNSFREAVLISRGPARDCARGCRKAMIGLRPFPDHLLAPIYSQRK